jgi:hypothetical protein
MKLAYHVRQYQTAIAFEVRHQLGQEAEKHMAQTRLATIHTTMSASCTAGSEERAPERVTGMREEAGWAGARMAFFRASPIVATDSVRIPDGRPVWSSSVCELSYLVLDRGFHITGLTLRLPKNFKDFVG